MNTIVVVDDEIAATDFLKKYINNNLSDFSVIETFSNGEEVIEYLKNNKVDIILTDIRMPKKIRS